MNFISDYQEHIDQAIKFLWEALPSLIMAIIIYVLGLWIIKFINRMVRKFFDKADYDPSLESFLQSFISIGLKIMLFVIVITQLGGNIHLYHKNKHLWKSNRHSSQWPIIQQQYHQLQCTKHPKG